MVRTHLFVAFICITLLVGCGSADNFGGEDYGDIAAGPGGITLTQDEHPLGWGNADCFECHSDSNIHQTDRTGTGLNLQAIRDMTENQGLESCASCHGTNGVD